MITYRDLQLLSIRVLFFGSIVALYLQLSLGVPFSVFLVLGLLLAAVQGRTVLVNKPLVYLFLAGFLSLLPTILSSGEITDQLRSLLLLLLSFTASAGVAATARNFGKRRLATWFWWISVAMIVCAALEVLGPLRPISDAIRNLIYSTEIIYSNTERDISSYGLVRPNLFASEPSHLGKFLALFLTVSAVCSAHKRKFIVVGLLGFLVVRSPVILIGVIVPAAILIRGSGWKAKLRRPSRVLALLALFVGTLVFGYQVSVERLGLFGGTVEASAFLRVVRPFYMAVETLRQHPFSGFGIGADQALQALYLTTTFSNPGAAGAYIIDNYHDVGSVSGMSHMAVVVQLGLLGGALWLLGLGALRRVFNTEPMVFWMFWGAYGIFVGSFNTPLFWAPICLVAAAGSAVRQPTAPDVAAPIELNMRLERPT